MFLGLLLLFGLSDFSVGFDNGIWHDHHIRSSSTAKFMQKPIVKTTDPTGPSRKLTEFTKSEHLTREVIEVTDNVYVAIGYALANSVMIEGENGLIIVDTTESVDAMNEIMEEFRKYSMKPVLAIIYTHFHGDHTQGTSAVVEDGRILHPETSIDIYAHDTTKDEMESGIYIYDISWTRGTRQIGCNLEKHESARTGSGLGPEYRVDAPEKRLRLLPTVTFTGKAEYEVAGIRFQLIHTPGETDDQITVWFPDLGVALPGDNIYKTFPNLYAIRGTPARDTQQWYLSLDIIRALNASYLIGSHTQPVYGKDAVYDTLLIYRDAMKYVHDQTLRLANQGLFPGEIVENVKLPERLANHPHLQEHYGSVEWSVKGVFTNYLGWFSGNPTDLHHMSNTDRAVRMLKLITTTQAKEDCAVEILLREAENSHRNSYHQYLATGRHNAPDNKWALELCDFVLSLDSIDPDLSHAALQIKISSLRALGIEQVSANGRNYYLTYAMELEAGDAKVVSSKAARAAATMDASTDYVLRRLCLKVKGLECQYKNFTIGLTLKDEGKQYGLTLRNSVCDVLDPLPADMDTSVTLITTAEKFKLMNVEEYDLKVEVTQGTIEVINGRIETYEEFIKCFDPLNSA